MKSALPILAALVLAGCAAVGADRMPGAPEFARVHTGMTEQEARNLLGPPYETMRFPLSGQVAWDYRYYDSWGYLAMFSVTFDPRGTVVSMFSRRLNDGGDFGGSK